MNNAQELIEAGRYMLTNQLAWGTSEAVAKQSATSNIVIMRNHGVTLFDDRLSDALMRLETLEMASRMIITAKSAGVELNKIPDHVISCFLEESRYKPRKRINYLD